MNETKISSRYAKSLFGLALENNLLDVVRKDIANFHATIKSHKELFYVLSSPIIKGLKKKDIINELFAKEYNPLTINFLFLVIEHKREAYFNDIIFWFSQLYNEKNNILHVDIHSSQELNTDSLKKITEILQDYTSKQIEPQVYINQELIGGVLINFNNQQLDLSIKKKLQKISKEFNK